MVFVVKTWFLWLKVVRMWFLWFELRFQRFFGCQMFHTRYLISAAQFTDSARSETLVTLTFHIDPGCNQVREQLLTVCSREPLACFQMN